VNESSISQFDTGRPYSSEDSCKIICAQKINSALQLRSSNFRGIPEIGQWDFDVTVCNTSTSFHELRGLEL